MREPYSYDWFDYDVALDVSLPGAYGGTDFDNRGPTADPRLQSTVNSFLYAHAGAQVQLGALGVSATGELFQYGITPSGGGTGVSLIYGRYHALVGYSLFNDEIVFGGGVRIVTLQVKAAGSTLAAGQTLLTLDGVGPEVGLLWKPSAYPFRVGTTFRSAVGATVAGFAGQVGGFIGQGGGSTTPSSAQQTDGYYLPATATVPWELETGMAVQLGPRPMSPPWLDPHVMEADVRARITAARATRQSEYQRELAITPPAERPGKLLAQRAYEADLRAIEDQELDSESARLRAIRVARDANWPRERITILASLLVTGTSTDAVSLEGFASKTFDRVGQSVSLSPRVGVESEPIPNWLIARVGSYLEPSRFADGTPRQHFTAGADVKLIRFSPWNVFGYGIWRLTFGADLAPRYQNYGIGLGAWH